MKIEWSAVAIAVGLGGSIIGYLIYEGVQLGQIRETNIRQDLSIRNINEDKQRIIDNVFKNADGVSNLGDRVSKLEGRVDAYHPGQVLVPDSMMRPWQRPEPTPSVTTDERGMR